VVRAFCLFTCAQTSGPITRAADNNVAFSLPEKLVIEYAEAMTKAPVAVSDELFAGLKRHFSEAQLVELTTVIAWENFRARFNHALRIEAQDFSKGAYCVLRESPGAER
jgi:alkylhydroperoxidase family enzyme